MVPDFPEVPLRAVRTEKYLDTRMLLLPLAMACVMQRQWHVADKLLQTILLRSCILETHHAPKHVLQDANKDYHYELLINIYIKMFPVVNILSIRSFMQISMFQKYSCDRFRKHQWLSLQEANVANKMRSRMECPRNGASICFESVNMEFQSSVLEKLQVRQHMSMHSWQVCVLLLLRRIHSVFLFWIAAQLGAKIQFAWTQCCCSMHAKINFQDTLLYNELLTNMQDYNTIVLSSFFRI